MYFRFKTLFLTKKVFQDFFAYKLVHSNSYDKISIMPDISLLTLSELIIPCKNGDFSGCSKKVSARKPSGKENGFNEKMKLFFNKKIDHEEK